MITFCSLGILLLQIFWSILLCINFMLAHQGPKRASVLVRRPGGPRDVALRTLERLLNVLSLKTFN